MEKLYHLTGTEQLTPSVIERLLKRTERYENYLKKGERNLDELSGVTICSLFFEESTRTRFSLERAAHRLSANVISTENAARFSAAAPGKEESLEHTIEVISGIAVPHLRLADIIVIRHPEIGAAERAAKVSGVPIISGGDGSHHPFQVIKDLYTFKKILGRLSDFVIPFSGDLRFSRIIRDLAVTLSQYPRIKMIFVAPRGFEIGEELRSHLRQKGIEFEEVDNIGKAVCQSDIAYIVRVQKNRMRTKKPWAWIKNRWLLWQYHRNRDKFAVTKEIYDLSEEKGTIFCHPMPVDKEEREIRPEVENLPRVKMLEEAGNGVPVGMAILIEVWSAQQEIDRAR